MLLPCHSALFLTKHSTRSSCHCRPVTRPGRRRWWATLQALRWRRSLLARGCAHALCPCAATRHAARDSFMTAATASARALHQHGMLPVATPRRRQHRFSRAMRGPLMCYQQSLTPMGSSLRSCTDMWHAVIESQHWGPLPAESHAYGSSFALLHCIVARCHQKSAQGSGVALRRSDAPAARV